MLMAGVGTSWRSSKGSSSGGDRGDFEGGRQTEAPAVNCSRLGESSQWKAPEAHDEAWVLPPPSALALRRTEWTDPY
jgi:hypothetical protein